MTDDPQRPATSSTAMLASAPQQRALRWWLGVCGIVAAVVLVYASIVPLEYQPLAFDVAVERFRNLRWLDLGVYRRADWVANGLVALPFGFLLAGAADRDRRFTIRYAVWLLLIIGFGNLWIVGIEFLQLWYPRRTVSGNDIAAGCIGATVGPLLWMVAGRPSLAAWQRVRRLAWNGQTATRIASWLVIVFSACLLLYSVMPLDLMFSRAEWQAKWNAGRFAFVPELHVVALDPRRGLWELALAVGLSAVRFVPFGFLLGLAKRPRAAAWLIGFPVLIELLQAPIFTRYTTFADVLCGWAGGLIGLLLAVRLPTLRRWNEVAAVRWGLAAGLVAGTLYAFVGRYERIASAAEIAYAWEQFWAAPFVKYYYTSEFLAGSNVLGKMIVFAALGVGLANLFGGKKLRVASCELRVGGEKKSEVASGELRGARGRLRLGFALAALVVVGLGMLIEVAQVYLVPFYADASDVLIYTAGAGFGWAGYRIVMGWRGE